jgi:hypothetical protein
MMNVVYTAIFGGSDALKQAPAGADRCVCFTDDPHLTGHGWEIIQRAAEYPRHAARAVKVSSHALFPEATRTVWIDGSITIRDWERLLHDTEGAEIACLPHPDREDCYEEGREVIRLKIAPADAVTRALERYRSAGFAPTRLSTTGLLVRANTPAIASFNELWRSHLSQYGTNDQVHIDFCAWTTGIRTTWLEGHYRSNPYMVYDRDDHHRRRKPRFLLLREVA